MFRVLTFLLLAICLQAEIIPSTRVVPWILGTTCGREGGIPAQTQTIYQTLTSSATAAQINTALSNCPSGQVVKLGAGTFSLSATINLATGSGKVLRGSGMGVTILDPSHNDTIISMEAGDPTPPAGTNISSGVTKGSTSVVVASATGITVGKLVKFDQLMDQTIMWADNQESTRRTITQMGLVTNVAGTTITFKPALNYGSTGVGTPQLHVMATQLENCGLEDMTIDATGQATVWGVLMTNCANCWISNVRTIKVDRYHIYLPHCLFCEFTKVYCDDSPDYLPNHGGIVCGNVDEYCSTGIAVYNSIFNKILPGIEVNGGTSGSIFCYNFIWDPRYGDIGTGTQSVGINMNHGPENCYNLYEGNYVNQISSDGYFGGSIGDTVFRNWSTGWTTTFGHDNSKCIDLNKWALYANVVGNVLGYSNFTPDYLDIDLMNYGYEISTIYRFGYPNGGNGDWSVYRPPSTDRIDARDAAVETTALIHGNWDKKTGAQVWDGSIADHSIPNSLVTPWNSVKPAWFGNLTWPPANPGLANPLALMSEGTFNPAGYRFNNAGADPPPESGASLTTATLTTTTLKIN